MTNVEQQWSYFLEKIRAAELEFVPSKMIDQYGNRNIKHDSPMDKKAMEATRKKHRCWQRYLETRDEEKYREYTRQRNKVRSMSRKIQREAEKGISRDAKKNSKKFWRFVRSKLKTATGIADLEMTSDGKSELATSDEAKAQTLCDFFSSVYTEEPTGITPDLDKRTVAKNLRNLVVTEDQVLKKLKKLKIDKAPGPDCLHPRILNELQEEMSKILTIIFNKSLEEGSLPKDWKSAHVSAIFKKGNKAMASNYRPVSLTCIVCKVMEAIVRDSIMRHMFEHRLFSSKQFGFIGGRSTVTQLLKVLDEWTSILDEGGCVDIIYMDFQKAFDTVPHRRLIQKLTSYGIGGKVLEWITAFLTTRLCQLPKINKYFTLKGRSEWNFLKVD